MEYKRSDSSSSEEDSVTNYKEKTPCEICGSDANDHLIMTCYNCRETREHIYCARVLFKTVPDRWICDECCISIRVLFIKHGFAKGPNETARSWRLNCAYNRVSVASKTSHVDVSLRK
ncbi:unnamed protein product [Eruca vesicaria subsp. sativa]|uniref:Zinc finger PHD-type domain-containing protein n=1 Tax=Eruca vesicaria subsp. sativa TaxID=29727 RepID=A0ABC8KVM4_ERUVS|nr:unnamed protein product [Eruca vesicaria subsp. sativa]